MHPTSYVPTSVDAVGMEMKRWSIYVALVVQGPGPNGPRFVPISGVFHPLRVNFLGENARNVAGASDLATGSKVAIAATIPTFLAARTERLLFVPIVGIAMRTRLLTATDVGFRVDASA